MKKAGPTDAPKVTVTDVQPWSADEWSGCTATFTLDREMDDNPDAGIRQAVAEQIFASDAFRKYREWAKTRTVRVYENGSCEGEKVSKPVFVPKSYRDFDDWSFRGKNGQMSGSFR